MPLIVRTGVCRTGRVSQPDLAAVAPDGAGRTSCQLLIRRR